MLPGKSNLFYGSDLFDASERHAGKNCRMEPGSHRMQAEEPMERQQQAPVRERHGSGEIRFADQWLATVTYTIFQRGATAAGSQLSAAQEPCGAWGSVIVVTGERYLPVGATCELRLNNGRKCLVALQAPSKPGAGKFPVQFLQPDVLQDM